MNIKLLFLAFWIFTVSSASCFSQTKLYLDENSKEISLQEFKKKCNSSYLYNCSSYKKDSIVFSQILFRNQFGKISPQEYEQVRKLIIKDANVTIQPDQIIIINQQDSLLSYKRKVNLHKEREIKYAKMKAEINNPNKSTSKINYNHYEPQDFNKEIFDKIVSHWVKRRTKCKKKYEKRFNIKMIYLHMDDPSLEKAYTDFKWLKDRGVLSNIFFAYHKLHHTLILKPDGEYFLLGSHFKTKYFKKLIKNSDWSKYKRDHKKTLSGDYPGGKGIFKYHRSRYHLIPCF